MPVSLATRRLALTASLCLGLAACGDDGEAVTSADGSGSGGGVSSSPATGVWSIEGDARLAVDEQGTVDRAIPYRDGWALRIRDSTGFQHTDRVRLSPTADAPVWTDVHATLNGALSADLHVGPDGALYLLETRGGGVDVELMRLDAAAEPPAMTSVAEVADIIPLHARLATVNGALHAVVVRRNGGLVIWRLDDDTLTQVLDQEAPPADGTFNTADVHEDATGVMIVLEGGGLDHYAVAWHFDGSSVERAFDWPSDTHRPTFLPHPDGWLVVVYDGVQSTISRVADGTILASSAGGVHWDAVWGAGPDAGHLIVGSTYLPPAFHVSELSLWDGSELTPLPIEHDSPHAGLTFPDWLDKLTFATFAQRGERVYLFINRVQAAAAAGNPEWPYMMTGELR